MKTGKLIFEKLIQDSQVLGTNADHMTSRLFFSFEVDGKRHDGLFAYIKQIVGGNFEAHPLEVSKPENYRGPFNYEEFRKRAEQYYRAQAGSTGSGIRVGPGVKVDMTNNVFTQHFAVEIPITDSEGSW